MSKFAIDTEVSPERSRAEIESILKKYGATQFAYATELSRAAVMFEANGRRVRFVVPIPTFEDSDIKFVKKGGYTEAPKEMQRKRIEKFTRQRWRALALAIKAKLEVVESGISTFEDEFLAHVILPNGQTTGQWMKPQIQNAYASGKMPPLLGYSEE